jgi:hypothetical protein
MLEISPCEHKWIWSMIFIRIPKNASTSIYNHLGDFNLIHKHKKEFDRLKTELLKSKKAVKVLTGLEAEVVCCVNSLLDINIFI